MMKCDEWMVVYPQTNRPNRSWLWVDIWKIASDVAAGALSWIQNWIVGYDIDSNE